MLLPSDPAPSAHLQIPLAAPPVGGDQAPSPALFTAASCLARRLADGRALDPGLIRTAMTDAYGGSDADGRWTWRDAYDACEAAQVLFLRRHGPAMLARASGNAGVIVTMLERLASLAPSQTRRSEGSVALQQFSTPLPLGYVASLAGVSRPGDLVLEPSAGTGLLAVFAEIAGAALALNEIAPARAALLASLFPGARVTRHDSEAIDDRLDTDVRPSVILMNPPFSASPRVDDRRAEATWKHVSSALRRLRPGGRLIAITAAWFAPEDPSWSSAFDRMAERGGRLVLTVPIAGSVFARHGTTVATRLTIIDKVAGVSGEPPASSLAEVADVTALLKAVQTHLLPRLDLDAATPRPATTSLRATLLARTPRPRVVFPPTTACTFASAALAELAYEPIEDIRTEGIVTTSDGLYEPYALQAIRIPGALPHPTPLVQSAAMASVGPPRPSYRPRLPVRLVRDGILSNAQLETLVYAGEAHAEHLDGRYSVDETGDRVAAAAQDAENAVRFRRGFMLGDGTGAGKGRQVAGIILDNWLQGRRRALWLSKSDTLLEDAQRDWSALGGERHQVVPLSRWRQGSTVALAEGILFITYATLRSEERDGKASRLRQVLDWLGTGFDGVVAIDEAHALGNAAGGSGDRGDVAPSLQGRAGLRLQNLLPDARVIYVSATGASRVQSLAYAPRLGLWGAGDMPFPSRADFVAAMEAGGVAALEVLARDLKSLGLYFARSLSFHGVEYEIVEHALSHEQTRIYDLYAAAFQVIHTNLEAALEATNITGEDGRALNRQAKSATRSAFESNKQRFFGHLLTGMKCPTLIAAVARDLAEGHAPVIQLVSTGEALLERRLAQIPPAEWGDVQVDVTPREYVLDYLQHSWPTQLFEVYADEGGNLHSRPAVDEAGQPVVSREAVERRDRMIERLAALPPVQSALDQVVQHFGTGVVAEVTGRSRRIVRKPGSDGHDVLAVERRPASSNLAETQAFMDGAKRVLVFSDAGGTGRSYHADLGSKNQRRRVHYLLEPGWRADNAVQGLGRTNRTNQASPPLFRPVTTDVKGERRFISTIARRLDALGAITRGQRQTGGQNLFRPEDNLESDYARIALRQFYGALYRGQVEGCSLEAFETATGLDLTDRDGSLREELPPIQRFLNRLLALPIALQNNLFGVFETHLTALVESAKAGGTFDQGVETIVADSLAVTESRIVYTHAKTGAETRLLRVVQRDRRRPLGLFEALQLARAEPGARLLVNTRSGRAAVQVPAWSLTREDGSVETRVRLVKPVGRELLPVEELVASQWREADRALFASTWEADVARLPEFHESTFHVLSGLLLPIWTRLPSSTARVYRLRTDDGERVIGRVVEADALDGVLQRLGVEGDRPVLSPREAFEAVLGGATLHLAEGVQVRRSLVMGAQRIEVTGFGDGALPRLKALGLWTEIIAWKLRLFVPADPERGPVILGSLLERHPLVRVGTRAADRHTAAA